jgi:hypothetical protein
MVQRPVIAGYAPMSAALQEGLQAVLYDKGDAAAVLGDIATSTGAQ